MPRPSLAPTSGALVGISSRGLPGQVQHDAIGTHEAKLGLPVQLPHFYKLWNDKQPDASIAGRARGGQVPLIAWQGRRFDGSVVGWANIAAGREDAWIDAQAARYAAVDGDFIASFENEIEDLAPTNGSHADYRRAAQRIITRFRAAGADRVRWAYVVMGVTTANKQAQVLAGYPGDEFIDWVAYDPYNWFDTPGRNNPWKTFDQTIGPWYAWATTNLTAQRPYMLAEYGSVVDPADPLRRRRWFQEAADIIEQNRYPLLRALCYFDQPRPPGSGDWTLGDGADFDAYREMVCRLAHMRRRI